MDTLTTSTRTRRLRVAALAGAAALGLGTLGLGSTAAAAAPAAGTGTPTCSTAELSVRVLGGSPGAGQRYGTLVLTNAGHRTCAVHGFGGLALLGAPGQGVPTDLRRMSDQPVQSVVLPPGGSARSALHWTVIPAVDENGVSCQPVARTAVVTPPGQTSALLVGWGLGAVCQHGLIGQEPYVPGSAAF